MKAWQMKVEEQKKLAILDTVQSILDRKGYEVASISPCAMVYEAVAEMALRGIGALTVVADGKLVGIISERDYARKVILQGKSSKATMVEDIMTPSPITVKPGQTIEECLRIVAERRIRHLPVVEQGRLMGIVSAGDLIKAMLSAQSYTIDQLRSYIATEYPS